MLGSTFSTLNRSIKVALGKLWLYAAHFVIQSLTPCTNHDVPMLQINSFSTDHDHAIDEQIRMTTPVCPSETSKPELKPSVAL